MLLKLVLKYPVGLSYDKFATRPHGVRRHFIQLGPPYSSSFARVKGIVSSFRILKTPKRKAPSLDKIRHSWSLLLDETLLLSCPSQRFCVAFQKSIVLGVDYMNSSESVYCYAGIIIYYDCGTQSSLYEFEIPGEREPSYSK